MEWGKQRGGFVAAALAGILLAAGWATGAMAAGADTRQSDDTGRRISFGIDREEYDAQARAAMQVDPVVARHLGAIRSVSLDEPASMDEPGPDVLVYDVEGSRGKGRITARFITVSPTEEMLGPGVLVMADGTEYAIEGRGGEDDGHDHEHEDADMWNADEDIFIRQAREAAQRYPLVQQYIGEITSFTLDGDATGAAPGMNTFVFDLAGSKGRGTLSADFITVSADRERLGKGTLTLQDGRRLAFEGEPRGEDEPEDGFDPTSQLVDPQHNPFLRQAREAVQRYPLVQEHIGSLSAFELDLQATNEAEGRDAFVFDLVGDKGQGRILADFITVNADTERLGRGVLMLAGGREIAFEGEPPMPGEGIPEGFARQDGAFVRQARAAIEAHPQVRRHLGEIREARFDREASWAAPGDHYVFDLRGAKGQGRLDAEFITVDADHERIGDGELVMADGTRHLLR